ncbi:DNA-binding PadR family transcriptional regulator [Streptosporangium becharense]|uniref:DNA-binding PadR family transcriptional regulator n=1 Tax=Streptosporangium becharense TaxID=1816182 RepID=A0A7W9MJC0_9ACTN|nr:PadR family transcriptional regulator [Streptosporangium becharense]MBB2911808.1 DNA-binding PadR family transcriptional regulator [Streptosporangium becharense]MBB5822374.1 DNA-binding PadR family transcriptional regulator [Streptosporangium becharense]
MTSAEAMRGPWEGFDPREIRREMKRAGRAAWSRMAAGWHEHPWGPGPHGPHGDEPHRGGPHEHRHRGPRGPFPTGAFPWDFGRSGHGRRGRGGGPFGGGPFGGPPFGRGRKAKRGDVRAAILALLTEAPRNGYQIIQEIERRSEGGWKPSPGAVYPALQQLTDEGLVSCEESEGRKTFDLTGAGRAYVADHADEVRAPWEEMTPDVDESTWELLDLARQAASAMTQILQTGSDAQIRQARQILVETRRKLYRILADGDPGEE